MKFPEKLKPKNPTWTFIVLTITLLVAGLKSFVSKNEVPNSKRIEVENFLLNSEEIPFPTYKIIRDLDPGHFTEIANEATRVAVVAPFAEPGSFDILFREIGRKATIKYFRFASETAIFEHLRTRIILMEELNNIDPALVCQFSFPRAYGNIKKPDLMKAKSTEKFFLALKAVIQTGLAQAHTTEDFTASFQMGSFNESFERRFPKEMAMVRNATYATTPEFEAIKLAKAIILYHKTILSLGKVEASRLQRFSLGRP